MMSKMTRLVAVVPAAAALTAAGALATASSASAATAPMPGDPYAGDPYSGYSQGYGPAQANDPSDFPDSDAQQSNAHNYQPASASTGPNEAGAPRTSEAQTSHNEACGTAPGENTHTLGLPKLVNVTTC